MPTDQIVTALIAERDKLTRAIEVLQGPTRRRGRPPKNAMTVAMNGATAPTPAKKHARTFTAAERKAQSERLKAYWAKKRKAGKKG